MNSDVLDFLEEIDNTVNVFAVRAALKEVSDSVSKLTKNVHLAASITTDTILSLINLSNILEYVDDYRNAKETKAERLNNSFNVTWDSNGEIYDNITYSMNYSQFFGDNTKYNSKISTISSLMQHWFMIIRF